VLTLSGNVCGDGVMDAANEACDDGNTITETACPYGTGSCTGCRADCGQVLTLSGNVCGDGVMDATNEACDDGNMFTETACPYGTGSCMGCRADCGQVLSLTGNVCGDGVPDANNEICDDGNTFTETACPYGTGSCTRCRGDCGQVLSLSGNVCGDGVPDASNEACDDGNMASGDYCSADCTSVTGSCGDGTKQSNEVCDPLTYTAANPYCHAGCQLGTCVGAASCTSPNDAIGAVHSGDTWTCAANSFMPAIYFSTASDSSGLLYMSGETATYCAPVSGNVVGSTTYFNSSFTDTSPGSGCPTVPLTGHSVPCPPGTIMTGLRGWETAPDNTWTTAAWLIPLCATPDAARNNAAPNGTPAASPPASGLHTSSPSHQVDFSCPQGQAVNQVHVGFECFVDGIQLGCATLPP
jgi:cysteine-rich repeat protein